MAIDINWDDNVEREGYLYEKIVFDFTETVVGILHEKDIGRSVFASMLNVSPPYVTKLLNGVNITVKQMAKIAATLDCDLEIQMKPKVAITQTISEPCKQPLLGTFDENTNQQGAANNYEYALAA